MDTDTDENETEVWEEEVEDFGEVVEFDDCSNVPHPLVLFIVNFIALIQKKHYIPSAAISPLLKFLYTVFTILSKAAPNLEFFQQFPKSFHQMQRIMDIRNGGFQRYVVCEKCSNIYTYENCLENVRTRVTPKVCKYKASRHASICNGALLRSVNLLSGKTIFYPRKVFCFMSLTQYFSLLLNRTDFINLCGHWKNISNASNIYRSVYDGHIWKMFNSSDKENFFSSQFNFGLMLNVDWFKPCKHTEYSVGAIYLTVMNLPRKVRFKQEKMYY